MVRQAKIQDYDSILKLREEYSLDYDHLSDPDYVNKIQEEGFLIRPYPVADFVADLHEGFYVYEEEGKIVGYIRVKSRIDSLFIYDRLNVWMNQEYKDIYFNDVHHVEVGSLAVAKEHKDSDILKQILHTMLIELKSQGFKYLFSSIIYAPFINMPLMIWHESNGFEKVCLTTPTSTHGMENVQGLLYVKEI